MQLYLGIDTGGTYTDAVLFEPATSGTGIDAGHVVAKSKSLTTRHDLTIGIAGAVDAVLGKNSGCADDIVFVSLSTTLATNALVEGQGTRVALIYVGFEQADIERAGLDKALAGDPVICLPGGHTSHGREVEPLDLAPLKKVLEKLIDQVDGFAVAGYFATRNPDHELQIRQFLLDNSDLPVTCSHELSSRLNGPKRALTTVLNARLIPLISNLIKTTTDFLHSRNILAPVMMVRGDGALISAEFAIERPIETILSGPAASIVGARWLTGARDAVVSDIGGTTSDIAILDNGRPILSPLGANVGGHQTMVEAVAINTFGLGGDSEISLAHDDANKRLKLGPRRLVPISLIGHEFGDRILKILESQAGADLADRHEGRFALIRSKNNLLEKQFSNSEWQLISALQDWPQPLSQIIKSGSQLGVLNRLVARGIATLCGFTPSDAMHVLGRHDDWNVDAALLAANLFARRKTRMGNRLSANGVELSKEVVESVIAASSDAVLQTALDHDGINDADAVQHPLVRAALSAKSSIVKLQIEIDRPLIGLGASANQYLGDAAKRLGCQSIIPDHGDVANAIGAVVGKVEITIELELSQPVAGQIDVLGTQQSFTTPDAAFAHAEIIARNKAASEAARAGAENVEITIEREENSVTLEGQRVFIDGIVRAIARGRPAIAGR